MELDLEYFINLYKFLSESILSYQNLILTLTDIDSENIVIHDYPLDYNINLYINSNSYSVRLSHCPNPPRPYQEGVPYLEVIPKLEISYTSGPGKNIQRLNLIKVNMNISRWSYGIKEPDSFVTDYIARSIVSSILKTLPSSSSILTQFFAYLHVEDDDEE